jgi:hypothetical protein
VSFKPLALFSGLTASDYLLWNWSLNGNHDVLALVSGLTLPPLSVACLWLLATGIARLLGSARRSRTAHARAAQRASAKRPSTAIADTQAASPDAPKLAA